MVTIADEEKGAYAWMAVNYALGTLGGDPHETTGVVELGGTSLKVLFHHKLLNLMNVVLHSFHAIIKHCFSYPYFYSSICIVKCT